MLALTKSKLSLFGIHLNLVQSQSLSSHELSRDLHLISSQVYSIGQIPPLGFPKDMECRPWSLVSGDKDLGKTWLKIKATLCVASTSWGMRDVTMKVSYKRNSFPDIRAFPQTTFCFSNFKCSSQEAAIYTTETLCGKKHCFIYQRTRVSYHLLMA